MPNLLNTDKITLELLREQLQAEDFTTYPTTSLDEYNSENVEFHSYIRSLIDEKWSEIAKEMGQKHPSSCYSEDFPPEAIRLHLETLIADKVLQIFNDDKVTSNINENIITPALESGANPDEYLRNTVNALMKTIDYAALLKISEKHSCDTDFNELMPQNFPKLDHDRKWTHSRSKIQTVSLDGIRSSDEDSGMDIADQSVDVEETAIANADISSFLNSCDETDRQIIKMLMDKFTQQEIAAGLGIAQGSVSKRIAKIRTRLQEFLKTE